MRQLQNFIERLVVLSDGPVIGKADVVRELGRRGPDAPPSSVRSVPSAPASDPGRLDERRRTAEREALDNALHKANGNRSLAARLLGVSRRTLYNKLEEHGLG